MARLASCLAVTRQQQQRARQPLFTRVEELIDQVLFDPDVPREHVREEPVRRTSGCVVQHRGSSSSFSITSTPLASRRGRRHAARLARETAFAEEIARVEHRDHRFLAGARQDRQLHPRSGCSRRGCRDRPARRPATHDRIARCSATRPRCPERPRRRTRPPIGARPATRRRRLVVA